MVNQTEHLTALEPVIPKFCVLTTGSDLAVEFHIPSAVHQDELSLDAIFFSRMQGTEKGELFLCIFSFPITGNLYMLV